MRVKFLNDTPVNMTGYDAKPTLFLKGQEVDLNERVAMGLVLGKLAVEYIEEPVRPEKVKEDKPEKKEPKEKDKKNAKAAPENKDMAEAPSNRGWIKTHPVKAEVTAKGRRR